MSLNSCQLKDNAFVGMGAVIEEDCVIESYSIVAAGSKVPKKTNVPAG